MLVLDLAKKGTTGTGRSAVANAEVIGDRVAVEFEVEAIGATPTITYTVQGSFDGTNWSDLAYVTMDATAASSKAAIVATTVSKNWVYLDGLDKRFFPYLAVNVSANTNVTYSARLKAGVRKGA